MWPLSPAMQASSGRKMTKRTTRKRQIMIDKCSESILSSFLVVCWFCTWSLSGRRCVEVSCRFVCEGGHASQNGLEAKTQNIEKYGIKWSVTFDRFLVVSASFLSGRFGLQCKPRRNRNDQTITHEHDQKTTENDRRPDVPDFQIIFGRFPIVLCVILALFLGRFGFPASRGDHAR